MNTVSDYLIAVTAVSILCSILGSLITKKSAAASTIKMVMGIILALTVVSPLFDLRVTQFQWYIDELSSEAGISVSNGKEMATLATEEIIKDKLQSYILDKAISIGVRLEVDITLKEMIPVQIQLSGPISPGAKAHLSSWIEDTLGISKEAQFWDV